MSDSFESAARTEANKLTEHWSGERNRRRFLSIFTSGAEWARTHLAAQEDDGHDGWCGCGCQDAQEPDVQHLWRPGAPHRAFCGDESARPWAPATREESLSVPVCSLCHRRAAHESHDLWAAQEPTDAERAVRDLHTPHEEQVVTGDCSIEECDHEGECPTVPFLACTECWRVADEADTYFAERGVGQVAYPCPTIQALDSARAARRDEEKR